MEIKYSLWSNIDKFIRTHSFYNNNITKRIVAKILRIDVQSITSFNVRNRCINVFTGNYLYKLQLYGDNIKKDLKNRKLFSVYGQSLMSPIKVYKRIPLTTMMPILKLPTDNEKAACYILKKLKEVSHEALFKVEDYPLIIDGLNILENCDNGRTASKKVHKYLQEQEGVTIRVGIVHGDFHRDNIMCKGSTPVVIDFDCFRNNDIQAIDALYYILEEVRHMHRCRKSWLDEWLLLYDNETLMHRYRCLEYVDIDLRLGLIILLLERMSQAHQYDCNFIEINRNSFKKISSKLINKKYL